MEYSLTVATAKTKLNLALTNAQLSIQALIDKEASLVYNEDHLQDIANFIRDAKKADKVLEDEKTNMKAPYLAVTKNIDESYREIKGLINTPVSNAVEKYNKLCSEIAERKRKEDAEKERRKKIAEWIESTVSSFSISISESTNNDTLLGLERKLNLELTRANQYMELMPLLEEKVEQLRVLIKERKEALKEIAVANKEEFEAMSSDADDRIEAAQDAKQIAEHRLHESSIRIQESAMNGTISASDTYQVLNIDAPKPRRQEWKWEIVDMTLFQKKHPELVLIEPNEQAIKLHVAAKKASNDIQEETKDGLRIYKKITY